jgi:hypothetical protein
MIDRPCGCPFCQMPRMLSLAIEKRAFAAPVLAPMPAPKPVRAISLATAGRQLTNLDSLLRRGLIADSLPAMARLSPWGASQAGSSPLARPRYDSGMAYRSRQPRKIAPGAS